MAHRADKKRSNFTVGRETRGCVLNAALTRPDKQQFLSQKTCGDMAGFPLQTTHDQHITQERTAGYVLQLLPLLFLYSCACSRGHIDLICTSPERTKGDGIYHMMCAAENHHRMFGVFAPDTGGIGTPHTHTHVHTRVPYSKTNAVSTPFSLPLSDQTHTQATHVWQRNALPPKTSGPLQASSSCSPHTWNTSIGIEFRRTIPREYTETQSAIRLSSNPAVVSPVVPCAVLPGSSTTRNTSTARFIAISWR